MEIRPKKSLGQHFLNSRHVLGQIIAAANIRAGETVLEIGPGTGILTKALLGAGANVIAVEKDRRAYEMLKREFGDNETLGHLTLINGDILEADMSSLLPPSSTYSLVANIPYYITGAILEKFLAHEPRPDRVVLLVQKEVAERIIARPPSGADRGKESLLSISVRVFGNPQIIARVPRGAFTPPPTVDSAILAVSDISDRRFTKNGVPIERFFEIVRAGFAHKRKLLKRNLESAVSADKIKNIWARFKIDNKIRAEDLSLDEWMGISKMSSQ